MDDEGCSGCYSVEVDMDPYMDIDFDTDKKTLDIVAREENKLVDPSDAFITSQVFASRDELLIWARRIAFDLGFVVVILRSDTRTWKTGSSTYVLLGCERGGRYRAYKKDITLKATDTRKCDCPFRLKGKPLPNEGGWTTELLCGSHNDNMAESLAGHPYASRLSAKEKEVLCDMTKCNVKPKNILLSIKEHNEKNVTTMKQVYNARFRYRSTIREDRMKLQQLMKLLERDMYIHWHRVDDRTFVVRDLFWTHPDSVKLLNAFHIVSQGYVDSNVDPCWTTLDSVNKLERANLVVAIVKAVKPNGFGDLKITLKDPTGTVDGTVHRGVFRHGVVQPEHIHVGCALVLQEVAVFCPNRTKCYLNITLRNVTKVFSKDNPSPSHSTST